MNRGFMFKRGVHAKTLCTPSFTLMVRCIKSEMNVRTCAFLHANFMSGVRDTYRLCSATTNIISFPVGRL